MLPTIFKQNCKKFIALLFIGGAGIMTGSVHATENATVQQTLETGLESTLEKAAQFGNAGIVLHKGNIIAQTQKGVLFKGSNEPTSPNNKWHIGSITKPMTATMIGRLAAKGTLDMQATIAEFLPNELTNIDQSWHSVKLIDLLQHVSGAPANFDIDEMNERNIADQATLSNARHNAVMDALAKPLAHNPREKFEYSNIGYTIAGTIASKISGVPYEELMRQELLDPLGMTSAGFGAPALGNPQGHETKLFLFTNPVSPEGEVSDNSPIIAPAGTLHMTIEDLAKFGQMHLEAANGSSDFLPTSITQQLHTPSTTAEGKENYAAGWARFPLPSTGDELHLFHNGSNTLWYALLLVSPETETVIALTTNVGTIMRSEGEFIKLADEILSEIKKAEQ